MAGRTPRFGLNQFDDTVDGALSDDGGKFTGADRITLDRLLAAFEAHDHAGGTRLADPTAAPTGVLDATGGQLEGDTTYYYVVTYVDEYGLETARSAELAVSTPAAVTIPQNPGTNTVAGGTLAPGLYQYALTAHKGLGETPLSGIVTVQISDFQTVEVSFVAPAGADQISVWRQGPTEPGFTRVATVAVGASPWVDDGSVPADPCPCDPDKLPPDENTTSSESRITITAPTGDLVNPTLATRWRIYRSETSGAYPANSLLADISEATVEGGDQLVETYVDDGTVVPINGQPPLTSRTLQPSASVGGGGGGGLGGMLLLRSPNDTVFQLVTAADGSINTRAVDLGVVGAAVESFADASLVLTSSLLVQWRVTVGNDGVLATTQQNAGIGEQLFTYGQGPDLPTVDGSVYFRLGVADNGSLITHGDLGDVMVVPRVGGSLLSDPAAGPTDAVGQVGDFHLRRDNKTLTGPMLLGTTTSQIGATATFGTEYTRWATEFTVTADATVVGTTFSHDGGDTVLNVAILDASRNVIESKIALSVTPSGQTYVEWDNPVELVAGATYYVAMGVHSSQTTPVFKPLNATGTPDSPIGSTYALLRWFDVGANDWVDAPDETFADNRFWFSFAIAGSPTWVGADTVLLASRLRAVEDVAGATYTVVADDTGKTKRFTANATITLPDGLPVGTMVDLLPFDAGGVTTQAGGAATVQGSGAIAQYKTATALVAAVDTWVVTKTT